MQFQRWLPSFFVLLFLAIGTSYVQASITIDMEGFAPVNGNTSENNSSRAFGDKFLLTVHGHFFDSGYINSLGADYVNNGTDWLLNDDSRGITVTEQGGGLFSATSFDASEYHASYTRGNTVTVTGTYADNSTTIQNFVTDSIFGFQTFLLNSTFENLKSLNIAKNGYPYLVWDNVVLDSSVVPEPATLFVWSGLGLAAACSYYAKNRKSVQSQA